MAYHLKSPLFHSGEFLLSPDILARGFDLLPLLHRHLAGDWGEICDEYRSDNARALVEGAELLSQYRATDAQKVEHLVTIVTAADRSYTVVFLQGEFED